jgi:hypothetical protein
LTTREKKNGFFWSTTGDMRNRTLRPFIGGLYFVITGRKTEKWVF